MIKAFLNELRYSTGHRVILVRDALGVLIVKIAGVGFLFGLHVMLARLLGAEQYGIYVYVTTVVNIAVMAAGYPLYLKMTTSGIILGLCCWRSDLSSAVYYLRCPVRRLRSFHVNKTEFYYEKND